MQRSGTADLSLTRTKSETLESLRPLVRRSRVLPQVRLTWEEWQDGRTRILHRIGRRFDNGGVIVRSSALDEDTIKSTNAGRFATVPDIDAHDLISLAAAVDQVFASYSVLHRSSQVFVQPMLRRLAALGVVLTRDQDTLAPYYVVSFDDAEDGSARVTAGTAPAPITLIHLRHAQCPVAEARVSGVLDATAEIESLTGCDGLDIEFGVSRGGDVYTLQARPLPASQFADRPTIPDTAVVRSLARVHRRIETRSGPHRRLLGGRSMFGNMPDWNPAEMIGTRPRRLALSLYKALITDRVWARQRHGYGYRDVRGQPLLVTFAGLPYIDVRASFNSFVPAGINDRLAAKLVDHYLDRLSKRPDSHDKIEFDIVLSCAALDLPERLQELGEHGFARDEREQLGTALRALTASIIDPAAGYHIKDFARIAELQRRQQRILDSGLPPLEQARALMRDGSRLGALAFAGLARSAFAAVEILRSCVTAGAISEAQFRDTLRGLNSVTSDLSVDLERMRQGTFSRRAFLDRYGHLRPGTYDILSPRYDESFERYFSVDPGSTASSASSTPAVPPSISRLSRALERHGFAHGGEQFLSFVKRAIEGREYAKFWFSRSVSEILRLVGSWGAEQGFTLDDLSHADIAAILDPSHVQPGGGDLSRLRASIERNRRRYALGLCLRLPQLIDRADDIYSFVMPRGAPNFITAERVIAETVDGDHLTPQACEGRIAVLESADPGYDWILPNGIAGLATMHGGPNSHMAIRASEFGIPAAIGCGEPLFRALRGARVVDLDAANQRIAIVQ